MGTLYEMLLSFNLMSLRSLSPTSKCLFKMSMSTFTNGGLGCFYKLMLTLIPLFYFPPWNSNSPQRICIYVIYIYLQLSWWQTRSLPVVLPHELMDWLSRQGLIPEHAVAPEKVAEYWSHLKETDSPLKDMSPGHHVPLWIWGDGAKYLVSGHCLTIIVCGFVLHDDPEMKHSIDRCWPLCILQEESWCNISFFIPKKLCWLHLCWFPVGPKASGWICWIYHDKGYSWSCALPVTHFPCMQMSLDLVIFGVCVDTFTA